LTSRRARRRKTLIGRAETRPTAVMRLGSTCWTETSQSARITPGTSACSWVDVTPPTARLERTAAPDQAVGDSMSDTPLLLSQRDRRHDDQEDAAQNDPDGGRDGECGPPMHKKRRPNDSGAE